LYNNGNRAKYGLFKLFGKNCWIAVDILNLLSETKINYWFKNLLNCNNIAMYVHLYTPPTSLTNKHNDHKKESDHILIYSPLLFTNI